MDHHGLENLQRFDTVIFVDPNPEAEQRVLAWPGLHNVTRVFKLRAVLNSFTSVSNPDSLSTFAVQRRRILC